jgi:hypothetical protein
LSSALAQYELEREHYPTFPKGTLDDVVAE